jgi:hypothetical protein
MEQKRKNSEAPRLPGWLLLIVGFVIGVALMLLVQRMNPASPAMPANSIDDASFYQTATAIIQQATLNASGVETQTGEMELTATAIIEMATAQATPAS